MNAYIQKRLPHKPWRDVILQAKMDKTHMTINTGDTQTLVYF